MTDKTWTHAHESAHFKDDHMRNAHYWAAEMLGYLRNGPHAGISGTYYVDIVRGRPQVVLDADFWIEYNVEVLRDGIRQDLDAPDPVKIKRSDFYDVFYVTLMEPTGDRLPSSWYNGDWRQFDATGHGGDPQARCTESIN